MSPDEKKIPFRIEFPRILELLSDQIYQSPLALLRENTQNAFDAILMRRDRSDDFAPLIEVVVNDQHITVSDNGVGMTSEEIEANFWHAGKSGKNTAAARAAGVVGTFGIGALANFGVADALAVETESAVTGDRTLSSVQRSELSTQNEVISVTSAAPSGEPGTIVRATLAADSRISVQDARRYLLEFVEFVDVPVLFNGERLSGAAHRSVLPSERHAWTERRQGISLGGILTGDLEVFGMASGELRIVLENAQSAARRARPGAMVLLQNRNAIRTLRSGFGLATVAMRSGYQWGGIVDLAFLTPTAGREALDAPSQQQLQRIVSALDEAISPIAAEHPESFRNNDGLLQWVAADSSIRALWPA